MEKSDLNRTSQLMQIKDLLLGLTLITYMVEDIIIANLPPSLTEGYLEATLEININCTQCIIISL